MPLYEYQCDACATRFERIQKFSDPPVDACPSCSGPVRKLPSSPAIHFKGSGWYITDYAKKPAAGKGDGTGTADSATKSDAAPADSSAPASPSTDAAASPAKATPPASSTTSGS